MNVKEILSCYLNENKRIKLKLVIIIHFLKMCPDPIKVLKGVYGKNISIIRLFKVLILIHECIAEGILINTETIDFLSLLVGTYQQKKKNKQMEFDRLLLEKGI